MLRRCLTWAALPSTVYQTEVARGKLRADPRQVDALHHVDRLYNDVSRLYAGSPLPKRDLRLTPNPGVNGASKVERGSTTPERRGGFFSSFLSKTDDSGSNTNGSAAPVKLQRSTGVTHPLSLMRGLYLHGDVGCGKTHLMDLFYNELPASIPKRRVHFHQFMQGVHKDMHAIKAVHGKTMDGNELMREVAIKQLQNAEVLAFDELVVADVADAMILRRLFECMLEVGVCTIFTSNRAPKDLYLDGLNREAFLPFISLLQQRCHVYDMSSGTDHRLAGTVMETYLHPTSAEKKRLFDAEWRHVSKGDPEKPKTLRVFGRDLVVKRAVGGCCRFTFRDLCLADHGVADFSEIAKNFHTVFIEEVPRLPPGNSDSKRRFISLLDELYQYKVKVFVLAEAAPDQLELQGHASTGPDQNEETFYAGQLINAGEDKFQMRRAVSRLQEMRTQEYAKAPYLGAAAAH